METNKFFKNKTVIVTGGAGFLGSRVVKKISKFPIKDIIIPRSKDYDLRQKKDCARLVKNADIVIHLAATVGGIGFNRKYPATLYYDNILMGTHLIEESRKSGVKKFVAIGTICAYPKHTPIPFKEKNLWEGYPEETNAPYGLAKKMLLVQSQAYRQQYGFNSIFLLPVNLYGPGDNFDPNSSHVIPALIKKFVDAKNKKSEQVVVWGTGIPTREFLYVDDAAEAIVLATAKYNKKDPVNIGSSFEISIKDLVNKVQKLTNYKGKIIWDKSKPDGQPRRKLSVIKAKKEFGYISQTSFSKGLKQTINWYKKQI